MDATRASLLLRIRDPADAEAWAHFEQLYSPLLYRYARAAGLGDADAEDVRSNCYLQIVQQIGRLEYDKERGGFKAWLRTLVSRRVVDLLRKRRDRRADTAVYEAAAADGPGPDEVWDREWTLQHLRWCVEQVRSLVSDLHYRAFSMLVEQEASVPDVCQALGLNRNQVYKAKSHVLEMVRAKMRTIYPEG